MLKFLLVVILVAVAIYLVIRAGQRYGHPQAKPPPRPRKRPEPPRVIGPDDDPDFLRDLDRKRKHPEDPETP